MTIDAALIELILMEISERLQYGTTDLTAGVSDLPDGYFYFVYE